MTIGGNDVGYVPFLIAAGLRRRARSLPLLGRLLRGQLDPAARDRAMVDVAESLKEVGRTLRKRSPRAKVLFVDYLTLLPPAGTPASPLSDADARRSPRRQHAGAAHCRGGRRHGLRSRASCAGEPRPSRLVGRAVDDEIQFAFVETRPPCPAASQHRRNAGGRRPGRRTGELTSWADDRAGGPDQGLRPNPRRRRPDLLDRTWRGHRIPRPQRRRQDNGDADDPWAGPPDIGHRHHRRQGLPSADRPAAHRRGVAGRQAGAPELLGAKPPALDRGDQPDCQASRVDEVLDLVGLTSVARSEELTGGSPSSAPAIPSRWLLAGSWRR